MLGLTHVEAREANASSGTAAKIAMDNGSAMEMRYIQALTHYPTESDYGIHRTRRIRLSTLLSSNAAEDRKLISLGATPYARAYQLGHTWCY